MQRASPQAAVALFSSPCFLSSPVLRHLLCRKNSLFSDAPETLQPPEGFSRHQLVYIHVKTSSGLSSTRGALHDVFASNIRLLSLLDRAGQGDGAVAYLGGFSWMAA